MVDLSEVDTAEFPVMRDLEHPRPFSSLVRIDVAALSHAGKVRRTNEDHYLVACVGRQLETLLHNLPEGDLPSHFGESGYLMVVADGMGGRAAGEVASRMAISTLVQIALRVPDWILRLDEEHAQEVMRRADRLYRQVDAALLERSRAEPRLKGMGTTMTATYSIGDDLFVGHAGDSRAYLIRDRKLLRLTKDQTQAQLLADQGLIRQEETATHGLRHILTNALGATDREVEPDVQRLKLCDGDRLLLCSDGLTDMASDDEIGGLLAKEERSAQACLSLVIRALENGGRDNVTAVLARYRIPEA